MDDWQRQLDKSMQVITTANKGHGYRCETCKCWFLTASSYFHHAHPSKGGCRG